MIENNKILYNCVDNAQTFNSVTIQNKLALHNKYST